MVKLVTIKMVLYIAVTNKWKMRQLNISNAFFNENLMKMPFDDVIMTRSNNNELQEVL